ncbi:MAG: 4-hydroxy-tetrahydrodipicolinate synthase, partial [Clostridia bacterium]
VIAGTGSNDTSHAVHLSRYAQEAGADMVLLVPPYYNKTTQRGLLAHFSMIAGSIDIPIMLYNIPQRTGMNIDSSTMAELSHIPNITAVKECNMEQLADCISHCASDFYVYSGDDTNILTVLAFGGKGVVSVLGNILPGQVHRLVRLFLDGDTRESRNMFYSLYPLMKALFLETNPIPVKKAMQLMGMNEGILRMPLLEMSPENTEKLMNVMVSAGLIQEG